jgi:acetoin utilization protein AcuC
VTRTAFVLTDAGPTYDLGADHPMTPLRRTLAVDLIRAYGLDALPGVETVSPGSATDAEIERVHAPAYVAAVKRLSAAPALAHSWEAGQWGLAAGGDTPAFAGMHEAAAAICGASLAGARAVWRGDADQAFVAGGGLHHALSNRAAGFCIYNDTAVAIQALLDEGAERVAYIDIDVHHGDGTQWIFFEEPRVLTASVHETGRYLFPGTGGIAERGIGPAEGTSVNVPLPPFAGDRPYLRAIEEVIVPAVLDFEPDVIVTQDGADPHHADPLAHLQVTMATFPRVYRALHELAREAAGGRWVALGGGGYTYEVVPRAWTMLMAEMVGAELDDEIPEAWWRAAEEAVGGPMPRRMSDDPEPEASPEERARADVEGDRVVDEARAFFLGRA